MLRRWRAGSATRDDAVRRRRTSSVRQSLWAWLRLTAWSAALTYLSCAVLAMLLVRPHARLEHAAELDHVAPGLALSLAAVRAGLPPLARPAGGSRQWHNMPEPPHYTPHSRNAFTCSGVHDMRRNCTRCLPGWRGVTCQQRAAVQPCTLQRCLAWPRCPWGRRLRVHVYATPADKEAAWLDSKTSVEYRSILGELRASDRHAPSAADACLLVPWFDTLCIGNRCTDTWTDAPKAEALSAALEALPHWGADGANHLVFDMSSAYAPVLPIGRGIYAASSFWAAGQSFRHGHDQPVPLWNQKWRTENGAEDERTRRSAVRPLLLTFKGQRMFFCTGVLCAPQDLTRAMHAGQLRSLDAYEHGWVRNQLGALHNGHDVIIATKCARELVDAVHCDGACRRQCELDAVMYNTTSFRDLLKNSIFGLVAPGITPMSYRLAETLSYGAVPVIVSDFLTLPFTKLLDWHAFSLRVSESQLTGLPRLLRSFAPERVARMREQAVIAYERCFATPGKIALCAVEQLEATLFGVHQPALPAAMVSPLPEAPPQLVRAPGPGRAGLAMSNSQPHRALLSSAASFSHLSKRGDGPYLCTSAADERLNCTRCAPGWRGKDCDVPVFVAPCTPQHCLDWIRCPWGEPLTLHVYAPPLTAEAEYVQLHESHVWADVVATLRSSPRHVANASGACLLVPWFDMLCTSNDCTNPKVDSPKADWLIQAAERLPHWNGGANHVLLDMSSNHAPRLPVGRGFYMATSFWAAGSSFRHGHDQPLPLWNQKWPQFLSAEAQQRRRADARRKLLVFKGQRMFWCSSCAPADLAASLKVYEREEARTHGWVRNQLHLLHNGRDVITVGTCARELKRIDTKFCDAACQARCSRDAAISNATDFHGLLCDAAFGLVLPGITPMSYRLAETMACGAVPVFVSDFMKLPFEQLLDWPSLSVRVSEAQLPQLVELLHSLTHERVAQMRQSVAAAYERCFATPGLIALCAIEQLETSLFGSLAKDK